MPLVVRFNARKPKRMKKFKRIEKIVEAEPMTAFDFLFAYPKGTINGGRASSSLPGFRVVDGAAVTWIERAEFLENYVEVSE